MTKKVEEINTLDNPFPQTIRIPYKALPEAKTWQPGEKYCLHIEVEQQSATKDGSTFDIIKVGVAPDAEGH